MEMVGASQRTLSPHISQKKKNREKKQVPQDCGCDRQMPLQQQRVSTVHRQGKRLNGRPWQQRVGRGPSLGAPSNTGHGNGRERGRHVDGRPFSLVSCLLGRRPPKYVWPVPRAAKKTQQQKHRVDAEQIRTKRGSTSRDGPRPARWNGRGLPQRARWPESDRPPATAGRPSKRAPEGNGQGATAMPAAPPPPIKKGGNLGGTVVADGAPPTCPPRTPMEHHRAARATVA